MTKQPLFKYHLETARVGALGLSMGGSTALALAGARIDPVRLASYCDTDALNPSLCEWVRQSGIDLHAIDMTLAGRNNEDKRIRFAMAIDPAPADVFQANSRGDGESWTSRKDPPDGARVGDRKGHSEG